MKMGIIFLLISNLIVKGCVRAGVPEPEKLGRPGPAHEHQHQPLLRLLPQLPRRQRGAPRLRSHLQAQDPLQPQVLTVAHQQKTLQRLYQRMERL